MPPATRRPAGTYLRVSSRGQVDSDGFPRQHEAIARFARVKRERRGAASALRQRAGGTGPPSSARHEPIVSVARNQSQSRCWHTSVDITLS